MPERRPRSTRLSPTLRSPPVCISSPLTATIPRRSSAKSTPRAAAWPTTATTTASASRSSPASPAWPSRASRSTPGDGILSKFDTKTYASTPIGDTGKVTTWITGGKIDPATDAFLYSVKNDTEAALYSVDLQTAAATKLFDLENEEQLGGFYIPETAPADNVPAPVTSIGTTFSGTNLTGKVRFQMPRTLQDGTAAEGPLTYHIYANGQLISSGESTFGASGTQQIEVTVPAADTYSFAVTAENENGESKRVRASKIFVGPDTPKATTRVQVTDYKDGQVTLSWASVSNGLHGGNIDRNNLRYRVTRYPDGVVVSSDDLATYRMTDALPFPAERTEYYYTVEAVCGDLVSPATASPTFALGPITPAESIEFTSKANTFGWTALNPGTDTKAWSFYSDHVEVETNAKPADSWFVSPAINVKAGNTYEITLNMSAYSSRYTATFELMAGTAADAASLTEAVIPATDITSTTYAPFTGSYTATADGQIYLGIHATSANGYTLRLKGVSISEGVSTLAPAAVSDLQAAAGENGAHTATLTFTLPTLNLGGNALESITSVELQRNGETVKTVTEGLTPGAQLSITDDVEVPAGNQTYTVVCYNTYGAGNPVSAELFIGFAAPLQVASVNMTETTVGQFGNPNEWGKVVVPLDDYAGRCVQVRIISTSVDLAYHYIDALQVTSNAEYNLGVTSIDAPASVDRNKPFDIKVSVGNTGLNRALGYKVNLYLDDELLDTKSGEALEPDAMTTVAFSHTFDSFAASEATLKAEIEFGPDMAMGDNTMETTVIIRDNDYPTVTDLAGVAADGKVQLSWSKPAAADAVTVAQTEAFDAASSAWTSAIDGWTFLDIDKATIGGIGSKTIPVSGRQSFFVMDSQFAAFNGSTQFASHSGTQHLCSMYVMRGSSMIQSDDWAITPELTGKPQIVTLWASSFQADPDQTQYYETFQMLYSTTGTEPEDFTLIEEVRNVAPQWKQYSAYVPEGARYFAVRSVSYDAYMLFVDDVTFKAADGATAAAEICGYNVYRDSQLISAEPVEETAFADENAQEGKTYTYAVTTVYNDGESAPSNLAIIDTTNLGINGVYGSEAVNIRAIDGSIEVLGAAGKMVTVVTPAGAVLYSAPGAARVEIPVARGLYLVTVGTTTAKLAVE